MLYDPSQPIFWYKPLFMAQLLIAEYLFACKLKTRRLFALRAAGALALCFGVAFAYPVPPQIAYTPWYCALMFLTMFAVSIPALTLVFDTSAKNAVFCAIAGFTVQHISQELYELLNITLGLNDKITSDFYASEAGGARGVQYFAMVIYGFLYTVVYWSVYMLFVYPSRYDAYRLKRSYIITIAAVIVLIDVVFSSFVTYGAPEDTSRMLLVITHLYNILCCVLALFLLFELPKRVRAENELSAERQLRYREERQYYAAKENIDLINMKCHDMKHQIRRITADGNARISLAAELTDIINIYDSGYETENEALDVIITEKSLACRKQNIVLSCMADGKSLDFMKDTDIYSLFGNLLDNAMEAVAKTDESSRTISLSVRKKNGFLLVNIRNGYRGELSFHGGLPVTSKRDKAYHGFGMKSIKYVVDKYDGEMTITADKGIFNLSIVFPVP